MGQAGAQREPSMEEILASIRRIIENNEPALDDAGDEATDDDAGEVNRIFADQRPDEGSSARPSAAENEPEVWDEQPAAQSVGLAEVTALVRETVESAAAETSETAASESDVDDAAAEELRDALLSDEPVEAPVLRVADDAPEEKQNDDIEQPAPAQDSAAAQESGGQLVSLHTGEKVAAAFGELDAAITAGQNRSFDEIAEEMLRPMLTQWLDDNLPTLVERLVREEIERVSRGNRR